MYSWEVGICTHLRYENTPYNDINFVADLLRDLKITRIRDGGYSPKFIAAIKHLGLLGIKSTLVIDIRDGYLPSNLVERLMPVLPFIVAIEGCNEPDIDNELFTEFGFPEGVRQYQLECYLAWKSDIRTRSIPFLCPALAMSFLSSKMGDMRDRCDALAMHSYPGSDIGIVDNTFRWKWVEQTLKIASGNNIIVTETGYSTATGQVSEQFQAENLPRLCTELVREPRIKRVFIYELFDEFIEDKKEARFGLVRFDKTKKPAYDAIKKMMSQTC